MLINNNSPLRKLPLQLDPNQVLIFDGIRYAAQSAYLANSHLSRILEGIVDEKARSLTEDPFAEAFLYAWAVIDAINRLRPLVKKIPSKNESQTVNEFISKTEKIRELRDRFQHLQARVEKVLSDEAPVLGTISWFVPDGNSPGDGVVHSISAGSLRKRIQHGAVNPLGRTINSKLSLVTLFAHGTSVELDEAMSAVQELIKKTERVIEKQCGELARSSSDAHVCMQIQTGKSK